jgi:RNA polymerase sigma-70 factor (ECF subfamily)
MPLEQTFEQHRPLLFSLAYRMLGTHADAEDVVQEAWLRWRSASTEQVRAPKSYLTTVVARLSLDSLKSARRRRETYVGEWLPEPLLEPPGTSSVELAQSLSIAFLHVLETLTPDERVAFLLREVFDAEYQEIAAALDTSEANARQIVTRARKHIRERRPRFQVNPDRQQVVLRQFLDACASGDPATLLPLLTDDAVFYSDGGGKVPAAINPIYGPDRIARFFEGLHKKGLALTLRPKFVEVNGEAGAVLMEGPQPYCVVSIELNEAGLVRRIFFINNPEKLTRL